MRPPGPQRARLACLSQSPGVCSDLCSLRDAIQPSHPLSPPLLLPLVFPSIRVFSNKLALCIRRLKRWSFSFSISPSDEYELISFRIDWFDHRNRKASVLQCSAFFMVWLSHSCRILEKPELSSRGSQGKARAEQGQSCFQLQGDGSRRRGAPHLEDGSDIWGGGVVSPKGLAEQQGVLRTC